MDKGTNIPLLIDKRQTVFIVYLYETIHA